MIKLYGIPASRAGRCLWMLEELGIDYESIPTNFATGETHAPEFLEINPNGHIPALVDGDQVFWESMAINLYLAKQYDGGLKPKSDVEESHAVKWSLWAMTEAEPPLMTILLNRVMLPEDKRNAEAADAAEKKLPGPLKVLDAALDGRSCLVGDAFSVADLNVASVLLLTVYAGIDLSEYANVARWFSECKSRPASQRALGK